MAVPKQKRSKSKGRKRRTHYKATVEPMIKCSNCGETMRPHYACPHCGFYRGKKVITVSE
ncbi:MAG: 50S ribosomal protein L32 [Candidatus Cloacimonas sp. 4484_140]|nr:MAG: 50S ribosomal protein L32 [Candidatus Cloacimonas sp. 4484_140]HHI88183.1 50S ribosomal protein L32 [Candidatus Cloacimonadota bacterium]